MNGAAKDVRTTGVESAHEVVTVIRIQESANRG